MKKLSVSVSAILAMVMTIMLVIPPQTADAAKKDLPSTVRVGLYYSKSAVSAVSVDFSKGGQIFANNFADEANIMTVSDDASMKIRKDAYFVTNNGISVEYKPGTDSTPSGDLSGPFHIKLAKGFDSYSDAYKVVKSLAKKSIASYPALNEEGQWEVWSGAFVTESKAKTQAAALAKKELEITGSAEKSDTYPIISPDAQSLQVLNSDNDIKAIFAASSGITAVPSDDDADSALAVNSKHFRGNIEVTRLSDSDMTVVNVVPLEQYLYGVVPREINASAGIEAVKAQAVAARTYVCMNMDKHASKNFDMCTTMHCQAYGGRDSEDKRSNKAVDETAGKRLFYNGEYAEVYYFSSDGGKTENVTNVWGDTPIPYLSGVDDPYETPTTSHYNWTTTFSQAEIKAKLAADGKNVGDIVSMQVKEISSAGRITQLVIKGTSGSEEYKKEGIRLILGVYSQYFSINPADTSAGNKTATAPTAADYSADIAEAASVKDSSSTTNTASTGSNTDTQKQSSNFYIIGAGKTVKNDLDGAKVVTEDGVVRLDPPNGKVTVIGAGTKPDGNSDDSDTDTDTDDSDVVVVSGKTIKIGAYGFTFMGKGWGHAVGLSQNGAMGMAAQGFTYEEILEHYMPGTDIN